MIIHYCLLGVLAILLGQVVGHLNKKMPPVVSEEITYQQFFKTFWQDRKIDIKYSAILLILFMALVYYMPISYLTYVYAILAAVLFIVFSIDYRFQLIPDEVHVVIVLLGIVNLGFHLENWYSYLIGAAIGGGIFYLLSVLSVLIFKKEGMGFGDVKLMAALGFLFGIKHILVITLVSFFLGAIIGGVLLVLNKKKADSYIPFGPFIVIATLILFFISPDEIIALYISLCTVLSRAITDVIYQITSKG